MPLLPYGAGIQFPAVGTPTGLWGPAGAQHIAEGSCRVSLPQMLLTATSVLCPSIRRCWFSHCVDCAPWQARETDADTFYISNLFLFFFFFFNCFVLPTVNSSLLPWVIGLMSGNNRSLAPSHMISFFVLAACKNLSWSLES